MSLESSDHVEERGAPDAHTRAEPDTFEGDSRRWARGITARGAGYRFEDTTLLRSLTARFLLAPSLVAVGAAVGQLVGQPWPGLALGIAAGGAAACWLDAHLRAQLRHIRAEVVSGLVRPGAVQPANELDALAAAVQRFARATAGQHQRDLDELEHQTFLLDRMNDGLLRVAANGRVRYANAAAGALFGGGNPAGQSFARATRDHELHAALSRCLADGRDARLTVELPTGRLISAVIVRANDDPPEALVMLRDITEVSRLQTLRRDFVANVSHELRTPLATMKILAETVLDLRPDDAEAARYLTKLDGEIDVMAALVRDLLDLSRLEGEADALTIAPTDAARIMAEARERMLPIAARRGVQLRADAPAASIALRADERRLHQALVNLIGNAIAHTPEGGAVTLGVRENAERVTFSVRDTGAGIDAADLGRVWERFFKADRSRAGAGMGLGLAIVKHIALAHGGEVAATSEPGRGSEFTVTVPRGA